MYVQVFTELYLIFLFTSSLRTPAISVTGEILLRLLGTTEFSMNHNQMRTLILEDVEERNDFFAGRMNQQRIMSMSMN
ncbi:9480_t:CDS:2 [Acaulospora morrowiae]|uniref:9480_t:CDS:1 n=1 Tax=Acaulospora morrowiae TaxID=94023 RepID=A0A9N8VYQ8_9GLOM|nr:9480_t:CDS:2 [Acaulospora morrowiae]